jgi:2,5-diketo-D-gluconate reductase A
MTPEAVAVPDVELNDGRSIPQVGFGVYQITPEHTTAAVLTALAAGYRLVDTSMAYGNEAEVGDAVRGGGEPVFVTTKYFNADLTHGYQDAQSAFHASVERLGLEHVDLYLLHWPMKLEDRYVQAWQGLVDLRGSEDLGSIGVSNFQPEHLARIIDQTGVTPAVNQIELHPYFQQPDLREEHARLGIVTEAWGPLGQGKVLKDPALVAIGDAHAKTAAQVVLRWHLQLGNVIIPKSTTPDRVRENIDILDFELTDVQMSAIEALDRGQRSGPDPSTFEFPRDYRGRHFQTRPE